MYIDFFGLTEKPFSIAPDPSYLYMSEKHQEALAYLLYGLKTEGGIVLLTGEVGTGKTTLCKKMFQNAPSDIDFAFIVNPKIAAIELLEAICDELSIKKPSARSGNDIVNAINAHLFKTDEQGRKTVVVIDEAQNLSIDVLEQLRLLTNLETSRHKLLQILLLGQPELRELIRKPQLRQLSQRIIARYHLKGLSLKETDLYIQHRIYVAGGDRILFSAGAVKLIYKLSQGVPRLINLLCDRSLLGAYTEQEEFASKRIVRQASHELLDRARPNIRGAWLWGAVLLVAAVSAFYMLPSTMPTDSLDLRSVAEKNNNSVQIPENVDEERTSSLPRVEKSLVLKPLPVEWPTGLGFGNNFETVFAQLSVLWNLDFKNEEKPCQYAEQNGLKCLNKNGSLDSVLHLNRPVILTLYDDGGRPFYALLSRLVEQGALFQVDEVPVKLSLDVLENRWFGEYFVLWTAPTSFTDSLFPGQESAVIPWLAQTLERHGLYQLSGEEKTLEGSLLGALKRFQFMSKLTPDGVLGVQTIIQLNRGQGTPGPRLYEKETR